MIFRARLGDGTAVDWWFAFKLTTAAFLNAVPNPAAARRPEMKMKSSAISLTEMVILYRQNHGKSWKIMGNILMLAA